MTRVNSKDGSGLADNEKTEEAAAAAVAAAEQEREKGDGMAGKYVLVDKGKR